MEKQNWSEFEKRISINERKETCNIMTNQNKNRK